MEKRIGYIPLFLFLILSAWFLLFFHPFDELFTKSESRLLLECDVEQEIEYNPQGFQSDPKIAVYNQNFELFYSINGGQDFVGIETKQFDINQLENNNIINNKTSIRWKSPKPGLPRMKNVILKLIDKKQGVVTDEKVLTYYSQEFSELPIVHLTIKEDDLFDWNFGIMIRGASAVNKTLFQDNWFYRPANFATRGYESSRKSHLQYFNNGELIYESGSELKISGNATRHFPQKSIKLKAIDKKGRDKKFEYPFWGKPGNKKYESLVLRQSGNDNTKTMFADLLMHELASESKVIILNGFPVSVFINGNYWGIYNLRERIDKYMLSKRADVDSKDITILKCEKSAIICRIVKGEESDKDEFERLIEIVNFEQSLSEKEYLFIAEKINLKSFSDYIFFETYYANQDWLINNTTWFKAKDGQWKWILNDLDYSLAYPGADNVNSNLFNTLLTKNSIMGQLFSGLLEVPEFKDKFIDRSKKHLEEIFNEVHLTEKFNALKSKYEGDMQFEIDRWRSIDSYSAWEESCAANLKFLIDRKEIYLKQLKDL